MNNTHTCKCSSPPCCSASMTRGMGSCCRKCSRHQAWSGLDGRQNIWANFSTILRKVQTSTRVAPATVTSPASGKPRTVRSFRSRPLSHILNVSSALPSYITLFCFPSLHDVSTTCYCRHIKKHKFSSTIYHSRWNSLVRTDEHSHMCLCAGDWWCVDGINAKCPNPSWS